MSYWLETSSGRYLGDLATNRGVMELRDAGSPALVEFLDAGEADVELVARVVEEAEGVERLRYIADLLRGVDSGVRVTDGMGGAGEPGKKESRIMPYPNEHAARMHDPGRYKDVRRSNDKMGPGVDVIWGVLPGGKTEIQAIRFDSSKFSTDEAHAWLEDHDMSPVKFEPASGVSKYNEHHYELGRFAEGPGGGPRHGRSRPQGDQGRSGRQQFQQPKVHSSRSIQAEDLVGFDDLDDESQEEVRSELENINDEYDAMHDDNESAAQSRAIERSRAEQVRREIKAWEVTGRGGKGRRKSVHKSHDVTLRAEFISKSADAGYILARVLVPEDPDYQGDVVSREVIKEAAYDFLEHGGTVDLMHKRDLPEGAVAIVENWIQRGDGKVEGEDVSDGTWLLGCRVHDQGLRRLILDGKITGVSVAGDGLRVPEVS